MREWKIYIDTLKLLLYARTCVRMHMRASERMHTHACVGVHMRAGVHRHMHAHRAQNARISPPSDSAPQGNRKVRVNVNEWLRIGLSGLR